jgi:hypothetical protein
MRERCVSATKAATLRHVPRLQQHIRSVDVQTCPDMWNAPVTASGGDGDGGEAVMIIGSTRSPQV